MEGLTNVLIDDILLPLKTYKGCFSCDNIPLKLKEEPYFTIISNLSQENEKGTHFICIIVFPDYVLYIDPSGMPCFNSHLIAFLKHLEKPLFENTKQVQHINSVYCSFFCMTFVAYYENKLLQKNVFPKKLYFNAVNLLENDKKSVNYLKHIIKNIDL